MLNNSTDVELQGEMPTTLVGPTLNWLKAVKLESNPGGEERFYRLCRSVLRDTARSRPLIRRGVRWFGHKMPRHEERFETYEGLFDHPEARPRYVYCLRNPFDVWRSYRVMPWSRTRSVHAFLRAWMGSVDAFERMRRMAEDRVLLFNLDDMLIAPDKLAWFRATVLDGLGLDAGSLKKPVESLRRINSTEAKFGSAPPEVPRGDLARIARRAGVQRILADYYPALEHEALL